MKFSEKLIDLRRKSGLTQEELAEKINISRQSLSKWELGTSTPDTENILKLSRVFNVSTDYLLLNEKSSEEPKKNLKLRKSLSLALIIVSIISLILLNIVASFFDGVFYDGSIEFYGRDAFFKTYNLEWLVGIFIVGIIIGVFLFFLEKFDFYIKRGWRIG